MYLINSEILKIKFRNKETLCLRILQEKKCLILKMKNKKINLLIIKLKVMILVKQVIKFKMKMENRKKI